jgi:hypothetical protein
VICTPVGIRVEPEVYCRYGVDVFPRRADLVGDRVDGDDAWALLGRAAAEELADALGRLGGGQDR